jgi:hypothetical protein
MNALSRKLLLAASIAAGLMLTSDLAVAGNCYSYGGNNVRVHNGVVMTYVPRSSYQSGYQGGVASSRYSYSSGYSSGGYASSSGDSNGAGYSNTTYASASSYGPGSNGPFNHRFDVYRKHLRGW